ncbi:protein HYPER-SENSITIVITY-RELATED 4-like [Rhodamnia argentea]|uniref:Protein HYPER-SENSITIVITY-RELATED 4-like n=1 Tax=Rhodamnia argentea TaxID=178133 RepID=A0A8B8NPW0_9MYRT|nr:protein HYPER-SENSITIVITY-RELATED 4-like [Rhodamnia argentea]
MESTSSSESKIATAKAVFSAAASVTATVMLARSITHDLLPDDLQYYLSSAVHGFLARFSSQLTLVIEEYEGLVSNQIYDAAQIYLSAKISPTTRRLRVAKPEGEDNLNISMEPREEVVDTFGGAKLRWVMASRMVETGLGASRGRWRTMGPVATESEARFFELSFHKKHKDMVMSTYLPHVVEEAKWMRQEKKTLKLFTPCWENMYSGSLSDAWTPINLDHPATFETLAMEAAAKEFIKEDLKRFVKRREYYRKVGKAWKRGYLLYGPPGTGKSSLIAAMANYLKFDIYDLEMTELTRNSELRKLLVATANRSILVVEDIDCTIEFHDRIARSASPSSRGEPENQVTLSGFLNFTDGLWSSCGDERIIIFTTNHKEKLDPALLRPGRMDVHVHMSYCTPCGFRLLASNYLGVEDHTLFGEIEGLVHAAEVTPAEVAEQMMKSEEPGDALKDMVEFLKMKIKENEERKAKKVEEQEVSAEKEEKKEVQVVEKMNGKEDN